MATSWGRATSHHVGDTLSVNSGGCLSAAVNQCDMALAASGQPGTRNKFNFSVTNQGKNPERVHLIPTKLVGLAASVINTTFTRNTDPTFFDQYGLTRSYQTYTHHVGGGHAELDVQLAWDNNADPQALLRLTLISPSGAYAGYSFPQGIGNGFGRVIVRTPMAGAWKEIIWTYSGTTGYTGPMQISNQLFDKKNAGSVTPSTAMIQPGRTMKVRYHVRTPVLAGDGIAEVNVVGTASGKKAVNMTIPVVLRSLIPTDAAHGGSWSGTIVGGNGRAQNAKEVNANEQTFEFKVPAGQRELSLDIHLSDPSQQDDISGLLTDPSGTPVDDQSDITNTSADGDGLLYDNDLQFYHVNPAAGVWMLTLELDFYSSSVASEPFTGSISFNPVDATPSGLPDSVTTDLSQGMPHAASISVTNTTNVTEYYYLDPRLNSYAMYDLGGADNGAKSPFLDQVFLVPPETNMLQATAENLTDDTPVSVEIGNANGVFPADENATPDLWQAGTPGKPTTLAYDANNVPNGWWVLLADDVDCPSMCQGQSPEFDDLASDVQVRSKTVDTDITSDTGDLWQFYLGASSSLDYDPLVLAPGASGTINLTITPSQAVGKGVSGEIYLDTTQFIPPGCDAASCAFFTTGSTDELAAVPYAYAVGS